MNYFHPNQIRESRRLLTKFNDGFLFPLAYIMEAKLQKSRSEFLEKSRNIFKHLWDYLVLFSFEFWECKSYDFQVSIVFTFLHYFIIIILMTVFWVFKLIKFQLLLWNSEHLPLLLSVTLWYYLVYKLETFNRPYSGSESIGPIKV